jgi:hypothetical protein
MAARAVLPDRAYDALITRAAGVPTGRAATR